MGAPPSISSLDASIAPKEYAPASDVISKFMEESQALFSKGLTLQDNLNAQVVSGLKARGAPWKTPSYLNSWVDANGTRYRKDPGGRVSLELAIKNGTTDVPAFTLEAPYRPSQSTVVPAYVIDNAFSQLSRRFTVGSNGDVTPLGLGTTNLFCAVVSWIAAPGTAEVSNLASEVAFKCTLSARPMAVLCLGAQLASDRNTVLATWAVPSWKYQQDGQVRVTSIPGLLPDTDYLVSFLVLGG